MARLGLRSGYSLSDLSMLQRQPQSWGRVYLKCVQWLCTLLGAVALIHMLAMLWATGGTMKMTTPASVGVPTQGYTANYMHWVNSLFGNSTVPSASEQLKTQLESLGVDELLTSSTENTTRPMLDRETVQQAQKEFNHPEAQAADTPAESEQEGSTFLANFMKRAKPVAQDVAAKSWLDKMQDNIVDQLAANWEEAEEAKVFANQSVPLMDTTIGKPDSPGRTQGQRSDVNTWHDSDDCAAGLRIPKVALMFLTRGELYHEETWAAWFKFAQGQIPVSAIKAAGCDAKMLAQIDRTCAVAPGTPAIKAQHLFNVYIHTAKEFKGYPVSNVFHGHDIDNKVEVAWGTHSLIAATRNLLEEALQDPLNQRFVLLSESGIPLYPPTTTWLQLTGEDKSRINACKLEGHQIHQHRWTDRMDFEELHWWHWRKSSQWFAITREHAQVVLNDTTINAVFKEHCNGDVNEGGWFRDCYSDEHYIPTLLAAKDRENETDCKGFVMHVDWSRGGAHPRSYSEREISAARLRLLRMPTDNCGYPAAIKTSEGLFVGPEEIDRQTCSDPHGKYAQTLGYQCPLFARKFPKETASAITALMQDCRNRLRITTGRDCSRRLKRLMML
ncbi:hypothetical protein WJX72_006544 [[Myrmecia] bisecta]|uniref:Uncharacterized protein n=1 Tax=[Myrmecia] bisecta TaxID=41462 RepID=A0AAW1QR78_9CHLO